MESVSLTSTEGEVDVTTEDSTGGLPKGTVYPPQGVVFYMYIIVGLVGIVDNAVVIVVFLRSADLRKKTTCFFLINQSILDCLASLVLVALGFTRKQFYVSGVAGELLCRFWLTSNAFWSLTAASTYNLCAVSIEKYLSIVHPIFHKNTFTRSKALFVMASVWPLGFLVNIYSLIVSGMIGDLCFTLWYWPTQFTRRAVGVLSFVLQYLIPLCVFIYTYTRIFMVIRTKVAPGTQAMSVFSQSKKNSVKLLLTVVVAFLACFSWNQFFFLAMNLGAPLTFGHFYHFTIVALFVNSCLNPFIYIVKYREFRLGLKKLICQKSNVSGPGESVTTGSLQETL